jgi:ABC-type nitrate/sulfonate/bicarbonate transport system substrate-binding protein
MGGQPELAAGIENKRIFAAPMVPPALVKVLKLGGNILVTPQSIGFRFPHVGIVVRKSFLAKQRETVKNFLKAYSEGVALLHRDKERGKKALVRYVRTEDPELLESAWQYAIDTLERIPYSDPETFKVVLEDRARTDPDVAAAKPNQFTEDALIRELEAEGFFKKIYAR